MRHTLLREAIRGALVAPGFARAPSSPTRMTALAALGLLAAPAFAQDALRLALQSLPGARSPKPGRR